MAVLAGLVKVVGCRCRLNRSLAKPWGLSACRVLGVFPVPPSPLASFGSCPTALRLEGIFLFPTARPFGGLCAFGVGCWLLPLAPSFWIPSFDFQVGSLRLVLGRRLGCFFGGENKKCSFFWGVCP